LLTGSIQEICDVESHGYFIIWNNLLTDITNNSIFFDAYYSIILLIVYLR